MKNKRSSPRRIRASGEKTARSLRRIAGVSKAGARSRNPKHGRGTSSQIGRTYTKRRGEIAEAAFLSKASSMGFGVAKPWGDSDRYDLIVDVGGCLLRVQVKSAHRVCAQNSGGYHIRAQSGRRGPYRTDEIDLLVAYIVPEDIWYIFPPSAFKTMKSMRLFPYAAKRMSKFEKYREAWHAFHTHERADALVRPLRGTKPRSRRKASRAT